MHRLSGDHPFLATLRQAEQCKLDGKYADAIVLLESVLHADPDNVAALEEIADNELSLGNFHRALAAARRAVNLDKSSFSGQYILGFLASRREEWKASVKHLQNANRTRPNHPEILRCLGWSLFHSGDSLTGIVTLERALNLDPGNPLTLCDLGVVYLQEQNLPKAKALFARALELDQGNVRVLECLQAAKRIEKHVEGIKR